MLFIMLFSILLFIFAENAVFSEPCRETVCLFKSRSRSPGASDSESDSRIHGGAAVTAGDTSKRLDDDSTAGSTAAATTATTTSAAARCYCFADVRRRT